MASPESQSEPERAGYGLEASSAGATVVGCLSFGVFFRLHLDPSVRAAVLAGLPYATSFPAELPPETDTFSLISPGGTHGYRLLHGAETTAETADAALAVEQLCRDLMVHVANFAPDRVFVHAGVVGWRGRAILLPGPSFAGKTTLTAALVQAGATYYSDEYAVLDAEGMVHPYARDLQMRQPGRPEQRGMAVSELHGVPGTQPLRAAAVLFAQYRPGATWSPRPVTRGMAVLEMLRHTIPVQRTPARVMAVLAAAVAEASVWESERDEAGEVVRALLGSDA